MPGRLWPRHLRIKRRKRGKPLRHRGVESLEEREAALGAGAADQMRIDKAHFEAQLAQRLPGVEIVGAGADRLWNTVSAIMPETPDCRQRWVVKLDKLGFAVSTGSACASGKEQVSHVLDAIGLTIDSASRVLRFSGGWSTVSDDWNSLLGGLMKAYTEFTR